MIDEIESRLLEFVQSSSAIDVEIQPDTDLLTTNVMDSLLLMELVIVIENHWSVKLQGSDMSPQNFRSLRKLAELVASHHFNNVNLEAAAK